LLIYPSWDCIRCCFRLGYPWDCPLPAILTIVMSRFAQIVLPFILGFVALVLLSTGMHTGARPNPEKALEVVMPAVAKSIVKENVIALAGRVNDASIQTIELYRSYEGFRQVVISSDEDRRSFPKHLALLWGDGVVGASIRVIAYRITRDSETVSASWDYGAPSTRAQFWASAEGKNVLELLNEGDVIGFNIWFTGRVRNETILATDAGQMWFNASLPLEPGDNSIVIVARRADKSVAGVDSIRAFFNIDNIADKVGSGYEKYTFHGTPAETQCRPCHAPKPMLSRDACAPCHDGIWNQQFTHTPTRQRKCMACHDSTSSSFATIKSMGTDADMCYKCHTKQNAEWNADTMKRHAPVDGGTCVQCHTPHGSPNVMHTLTPINRLCKACHDKIPDRMHPVLNHPQEGVEDIMRPGRELACSGCHNPHASAAERLLRYGSRMNSCAKCHPK
jgi:predicted CXXCH cytochrome family protein